MKTLEERKVGTTCTRCQEPRWPFKDWTEPHTCQRCAEALAGGHAVDPLPSPAQQKRRDAARQAILAHPIHRTGGQVPRGGRS